MLIFMALRSRRCFLYKVAVSFHWLCYFLLVPWSLRLSMPKPYSPIIDHTLVMFPLSSLAAAVAEAQSSHRLPCPYMSGAVAVIFSAPRRYESVRDSWQDAHRYSYSSSTRRYSRSHRRDRHSHSHCCSHARHSDV